MFENIVLFDNYVIIIYTFFPILVGDEDNNNDNDDDDDNNNNNKTNKNNNKSIRRKAIPRCAYQLVWVSVWSGFVSGRPPARSKACFQSTNERVFQLFIRRFSIHNSSKKKKQNKEKVFSQNCWRRLTGRQEDRKDPAPRKGTQTRTWNDLRKWEMFVVVVVVVVVDVDQTLLEILYEHAFVMLRFSFN